MLQEFIVKQNFTSLTALLYAQYPYTSIKCMHPKARHRVYVYNTVYYACFIYLCIMYNTNNIIISFG